MKIISSQFETIVAIVTPSGEGAIGIIRLSGEKSLEIIKQIFVSNNLKSKFLKKIKSNYLYLGWIRDSKTLLNLDQVMVSYMQSPHSFTGEDVVEIFAHGNRIILQRIVKLILRQNFVRIAEPGEFTKRAFLNGKMDLSQAESVIDLIQAQTEKSSELALEQLEGGLSNKIRSIYNHILYVLGYFEATFDFVDDDIPVIPQKELFSKLQNAKRNIEKLLNSAEQGMLYKQGVKVVLIGFPNAGKSSLFNILLQSERAIVSAIPGTTRDTLREYIDIRGVPVELTDTAGITKSENLVEKEGVRRSILALKTADIILFLLDVTDSRNIDDFRKELNKEMWDLVQNKKIVFVVTKIDKIKNTQLNIFIKKLQHPLIKKNLITQVSVKEEIGVNKLHKILEDVIIGNKNLGTEDVLITNQRHQQSLKKSLEHLSLGIKAFKKDMVLDLVAIDLKVSLEALGEITGETVSDEILHNIFSRFCVGK